MRFIPVVAFALVCGAAEAAPLPTQQCAVCHRGIEDAHPKKTLACTTCHKGDGAATTPAAAHAGMYANPGDLRVAGQTCGACHAAITRNVKSSIMAHRSGT